MALIGSRHIEHEVELMQRLISMVWVYLCVSTLYILIYMEWRGGMRNALTCGDSFCGTCRYWFDGFLSAPVCVRFVRHAMRWLYSTSLIISFQRSYQEQEALRGDQANAGRAAKWQKRWFSRVAAG